MSRSSAHAREGPLENVDRHGIPEEHAGARGAVAGAAAALQAVGVVADGAGGGVAHSNTPSGAGTKSTSKKIK